MGRRDPLGVSGWVALAVVGGCLLGPSWAAGQVRVSARMVHDEVLQYEPIWLELRITNDSGQRLRVGGDGPVQFDFQVERRPGYAVAETGKPLLEQPVEVPLFTTRAVRVDLSRSYDLRETGSVTILARITYGGVRYDAGRVLVDVVPGLVVAERRFGVPGDPGETRSCSVRTLHRKRAQRVFLRIESEEKRMCFGVFDLGRIVTDSSVSLVPDTAGRIHVLHQSGPSRFSYSVFTVDGVPLTQRFYEKGGSPRLAHDATGLVQVLGVRDYEGDPSTERPVIKPFAVPR